MKIKLYEIDVRRSRVDIIRVNRVENWVYVVKYSLNGQEDGCSNDELDLKLFEMMIGKTLTDGEHNFTSFYIYDYWNEKNFGGARFRQL